MSNVSSLSFRNVLGLNKIAKPNILFVGEELITFAAGNTIVSHNINSRQQRIFLPPDEFSSGISAIAYAEGKPNVAFGDNSIQPSVCIVDIHSQHALNFLHLGDDFGSTGFVSLSFSSDGHYLLGHGTRPGWALVVWSLESNQRIDSIKTADDDTPVTQCTFSPGKNPQIAVTGDNILKIYKLDQGKLREVVIPNPKIGNIMCHLWLNETTLLCANSSGDIINVTTEPQVSVIEKCENRNSPFVTMARYKKGFLAASEGGYFTKFDQSSTTPGKFTQATQVKLFADELPIPAHTIAVDPSEENAVVTLQNNRILTISLQNGDILLNPEEKPLIMPVHDGAILSCSTCCRKPLVATCGADKTVRIWNYLDNSLEIIKEFTESVYCVSLHPDGLSILIGFGDKLRLCGVFYDDIRSFREFPIRGCRCAKFSNGGHMFAAVNGSKIQIYSTLTFQLVNTLHRHNANVHSLIWNEADTIIASVGNDGAMYVHRQDGTKSEENYTTSGIQYHSVTAKPDFSEIYVTGSDMKIKEIENGQAQRNVVFTVPQTQLVMSNNGQMLFSGSKDGKITSFSHPIGNDKITINCHTAQITSMAISFDDSLLFTTGEDGVLCIFNIRDKDNRVRTLERTFFSEEVMTTRNEIEEKAGQLRTAEAELADLDVNFKMKSDLANGTNKSKLTAKNDKYKKKRETWRIQNENIKKKKDETDSVNKANEEKIKKEWADKMNKLEDYHMEEVVKMHRKCEDLSKEKMQIEDKGKEDLKTEEASHKSILENMTGNQRAKLEEAQIDLQNALNAKSTEEKQIEEMKREIEAERIQSIKDTEESLQKIREDHATHHTNLNDILQQRTKEYSSYDKQIKHHQEEKEKYAKLKEKLKQDLDKLNEENRALEAQITQLNAEIKTKETQIGDVKKENQELDKYHSVLTHQENMLRQQSTPLDTQIEEIEKQISQMDGKLESAHKHTSEQNELIADQQDKLQKVIETERKMTKKLLNARSYFEQAKNDLHEVVQKFHAKDKLVESFKAFYAKYVENEKIEDIQLDEAVEEEHKRQKATLKKQLTELRNQHARDNQFQVKEQAKLLEQNAALINELSRLRDENKELNSKVTLTKKPPTGSARQLLPATEAQRVIEELKKKIQTKEMQLKAYNDPRPST